MGLFDKIRGEFIDIIEWTDSSNDTMVYRFERHGNEIKYGAKLTVRESQVAVFVNEGQIADVFQPGMYTLETQNIPLLSTLQGWKYGFSSPFKAEVYFVNTRRFTDLKWGTKNPVMMRDKDFGVVRLRAFGTYEVRVKDAPTFLKEIVGTDNQFTTDEVSEQLRNILVSKFTNLVGAANIPVLDLAGNYDQLGKLLTDKIGPDFGEYGLSLTKILVENISLPPEVEAALDKRTSMGVIGDLNRYAQFQAAEAMPAAAANPGGTMGAAMGIGMGAAMGQQMAGMFNQPGAAPAAAPAAPPPLPQSKSFFMAVNGQQQGPFDMNALLQRAQQGQLTRDTLVWSQGMANWAAAGQVAELAQLFAAAPPPLPPS
ncbi:MAG: SPFH domain-containing protein [Rhodospirillaceae bacterium]|nr:SPFH domain-containing protein [Rhodospirillaceae bacterium]